MAHPYHHYNYFYPYPSQIQHKKSNYYNSTMTPQSSCPTYPQLPYTCHTPFFPYPPPQNPYYYPCYNPYPNYLEANYDEFSPPDYDKHLYCSPPEDEIDNRTVESQECDSIPVCGSIQNSNHGLTHQNQNQCNTRCNDDDSTICSDEETEDSDEVSVTSNTLSKQSHHQKDIFYLRVPKIKNKNFHVTMNHGDQHQHPHPHPSQASYPFHIQIQRCAKNK